MMMISGRRGWLRVDEGKSRRGDEARRVYQSASHCTAVKYNHVHV